jgi:hypothetical protein
MRRIFVLLLLICFTSMVYAQKKPSGTVDKKVEPKAEVKKETKTDTKTEAKAETKTETKTDVKSDTKTEKKDTATEPEKSDGKIEKIPDGYGNLTWGMYLSEAKDKVNGIISYTDGKKVIVTKDKELEYYYGFFYKEPSVENKDIKPAEEKDKEIKKDETAAAKENPKETAQEKDEGKLFYVSLNFPYLDKEKVYNKIQKKYGKHSKENVKDNQGAMAWNSDNTVIIMWIDQYDKKPFCRRIIYISKKISVEQNDYTNSILNKTELELLKKLNP